MKPLSHFLFLLLISITLISCSFSNSDSNVEKIIVEGTNIQDTLNISNLVENIDVIKLNETSGNFLGEATKVFKTNKYIIVFDRNNAQRIVAFDHRGNFVKNVTDKLPDGVTEIIKINDCWLTDTGDLEVYDFGQKYIYQFSSEDFSFKKLVKTSEAVIFSSLMRIPKTTNYVGYKGYMQHNKLYRGKQYKLAMLDSTLNIQSVHLEYPKELKGVAVTTPVSAFRHFGDTIRFAQDFDPFIYSVTSDGFSKRYELQYIHKPFPLDFEEKIVKPNLAVFKKAVPDFEKINSLYKGYTRFKGSWFETKKYAFFASKDEKGNSFYSIYDKVNKHVISQAHFLKETLRFKMIIPQFSTVDVEMNEFLTVWPGYGLKTIIGKDSPLFALIEKDLEANYLVKVKLK